MIDLKKPSLVAFKVPKNKKLKTIAKVKPVITSGLIIGTLDVVCTYDLAPLFLFLQSAKTVSKEIVITKTEVAIPKRNELTKARACDFENSSLYASKDVLFHVVTEKMPLLDGELKL
ncbi:Uncharacterised protein [Mycoplasmopsis arginini]|nr:Uncharacterised protein [Chlamydia abortus]SGA22987.1 Uncharacterised protein [Mycoplasmopsis arginini]SGA26191.1 Uncharacterised protein [Mycoplasmopsis arginini]SGA33064.1 Uncharacterised protein [Chlamydia abortus]